MDEQARPFPEKENEASRKLRHDVRNQLSNIQLCIEELRYELAANPGETSFYLDAIAASCKKIDGLLQTAPL